LSDQGKDEALERARFLDRFVAFSIDYYLVLLSCYGAVACLRALGFNAGQALPAAGVAACWLVVFILYQSLLNSGGRRSIGKRLLGLQVYTQDGYPPDFPTLAKRSLGYLLSSVPAGLGFLWAAWQDQKLTWHDLLAGTMVLERKRKGWSGRGAVAVAAVCFILIDASFAVLPLGERQHEQMQLRLGARKSVEALALLEGIRKARTGNYTNNLDELGAAYSDPARLRTLLRTTLSTLRIEASRDRFTLEGKALDDDRTPIVLIGQLPRH